MFRSLVIGGLFLLSACASQIMEGYVGKSINEPILDYGPPTNVIELAKDQRAYQWARTNTGVMPITSPTTATVYGGGTFATVFGSSTTYVPYSNACVYTLLATNQANEWIVTGFRQPTLDCE